MSTLTARRGLLTLAVASALLVGSFAVVASASASTLYACVKKSGSAHVFAKKPKCKKGEQKLSWSTSGPAGTAFSQTFTQTGAVSGATFTLNSGSLPTGITLATNGTLSGTPTQTGSFPITVKVTDGDACTGTRLGCRPRGL